MPVLNIVGVAAGLDQHIAFPPQRAGIGAWGGRLKVDLPNPLEMHSVETEITGEALLRASQTQSSYVRSSSARTWRSQVGVRAAEDRCRRAGPAATDGRRCVAGATGGPCDQRSPPQALQVRDRHAVAARRACVRPASQ